MINGRRVSEEKPRARMRRRQLKTYMTIWEAEFKMRARVLQEDGKTLQVYQLTYEVFSEVKIITTEAGLRNSTAKLDVKRLIAFWDYVPSTHITP